MLVAMIVLMSLFLTADAVFVYNWFLFQDANNFTRLASYHLVSITPAWSYSY